MLNTALDNYKSCISTYANAVMEVFSLSEVRVHLFVRGSVELLGHFLLKWFNPQRSYKMYCYKL